MHDHGAPHTTVRLATGADISVLGPIWLEFMQSHERADDRFALSDNALYRWEAMVREMIERDDTFVLIAEGGDDRPLGFCVGWVARNPPIYRAAEVGFVSEIAVREQARRRGVGRALMRHAIHWFRERRLCEFQLSTAVWNEGARRFWEELGGEPFLVRYRFELQSGDTENTPP